MNFRLFVLARLLSFRRRLAKGRILRSSRDVPDLRTERWPESMRDPRQFYLECFRFFHLALPPQLQEHREYFVSGKRGFGEDAFHAMWFLLFQHFRPGNFLEIGVYRGQVLSLVSLLAKLDGAKCDVYGIAPFSSAGDQVSKYLENIDYYHDTLDNFGRFGLPKPTLLKALSTDETAVELVSSRAWDMMYIDGNHDYAIAKKDWELCSRNVRQNGIIILDDAGISTGYSPPIFATGGHPGPSRVAAEIDLNRFKEILQVGHNRVFQRL
jgi:hypothetical protein